MKKARIADILSISEKHVNSIKGLKTKRPSSTALVTTRKTDGDLSEGNTHAEKIFKKLKNQKNLIDSDNSTSSVSFFLTKTPGRDEIEEERAPKRRKTV